MPVPNLFTSINTTPASNSPAGSESPQQIDDHLRQIYAFLKSIYDNAGNGWVSPYAPISTPASLALGSTVGGAKIGLATLQGIDSTGTLLAANSGKCEIVQPSTPSITAPGPGNGFSGSEIVSIFNNSGTTKPIIQGSGLSMILAGSSGNGNRSMVIYSMCTIWYPNPALAILFGAGVL
jgi:hypothetical protein